MNARLYVIHVCLYSTERTNSIELPSWESSSPYWRENWHVTSTPSVIRATNRMSTARSSSGLRGKAVEEYSFPPPQCSHCGKLSPSLYFRTHSVCPSASRYTFNSHKSWNRDHLFIVIYTDYKFNDITYSLLVRWYYRAFHSKYLTRKRQTRNSSKSITDSND